MHHLSTVNLDTLSEFITTGVSFFLFLFVFSWRLQAQCRCTGPRPNQTPCMFPPPPGEWRAACFAGSSPVGGSVSWFLNSASFFVSLFKQDLLRFPNFILMSSPWSPLSLCGLCIWLCRRYSRGHWWFAFKMMWFVQIIFHLYYWDGSISFFFPWWFEVVRVVSYCLIKFSDPKKKKKKNHQFLVCQIQVWSWVIWEEIGSLCWHDPGWPRLQFDSWVTATCYVTLEPFIIIVPSERSQVMLFSCWVELSFCFSLLL